MTLETQIIKWLRTRPPQRLVNPFLGGIEIDAATMADDDCVVIDVPGAFSLVVGTDFVRGTGFRLFQKGKMSLNDVGYYLVAANASDLAAMGATPLGFLDVCRYSKEMTLEDVQSVLAGISEACAEFRMPLIGGDSGGYELPVLSGTALGICPKGRALLRRNGQPGDKVYLSGPTGIAGAASAYFLNDCQGHLALDDEQALLLPWRRPKPQLALGRFLSDTGFSTCAMDTSDGLRASIEQLARSSKLTMAISLRDVPISELVEKVAAIRGFHRREDVLEYVFSDSVDFQLLFTVPESKTNAFEAQARAEGFDVWAIGRFEHTARPEDSFAIAEDGVRMSLPGLGWDQSEIATHLRIEQRIRSRRTPHGE